MFTYHVFFLSIGMSTSNRVAGSSVVFRKWLGPIPIFTLVKDWLQQVCQVDRTQIIVKRCSRVGDIYSVDVAIARDLFEEGIRIVR